MSRSWLGALSLGLFLLLTACSSQQVRHSVQDPIQTWRRQQPILEGLTSWDLRGRIAVRAGNDGFNANFSWRQWGERYHIQLSGPFGIGVLTLAGDANGVALRSKGKTVFRRGDAAAILYRQTGVRLPIAALRYWVRGVPQREVPAKVVLDREGRLKELRQAGWHMHYKRYTRLRNMELPAKLFLDNRDLKVRLVIDRWVLAAMPVMRHHHGKLRNT